MIMKRFILAILMILLILCGCQKSENTYHIKNQEDSCFLETVHSMVEQSNQHFSDIANSSVYITKTGKCYHLKNCEYLRSSSIEIQLNNAISKNYRRCSVCFKSEQHLHND